MRLLTGLSKSLPCFHKWFVFAAWSLKAMHWWSHWVTWHPLFLKIKLFIVIVSQREQANQAKSSSLILASPRVVGLHWWVELFKAKDISRYVNLLLFILLYRLILTRACNVCFTLSVFGASIDSTAFTLNLYNALADDIDLICDLTFLENSLSIYIAFRYDVAG